ncbi:MAG: ABC transporter permease subunit [Butyrivibrio sp.]|nr:ABC transporter permease subunit [Butyrivibrio sp.]
MHIMLRELKAGWKAFLFWVIGLFFVIFAGTAKFEGIKEGGEAVKVMMESFPRIVKAMFGMVGLSPISLEGYYGILMYYVLICAAVYGMNLGSGVIGREVGDHTAEFLFSKPMRRGRILRDKLLTDGMYLVLFCLLNAGFSIAALMTMGKKESIYAEILAYTIAAFLVGLWFFTLNVMLSVIVRTPMGGSTAGMIVLLIAFIGSVLYDMFQKAAVMRVFTPFRWFLPQQLVEGRVDIGIALTVAAMCAGFLVIATKELGRKDIL